MDAGMIILIAANAISGGIMNMRTFEPLTTFKPIQIYNLENDCTTMAHQGLCFCNKNNFEPNCFCISTKGNATNYGISLQKVSKPTNIKGILESQFHIPAFTINRFQSFAYGVFHKLGKEISESVGVINLSSGVGCGVVINGQPVREYDGINGMGGLQKIKRLSDGVEMPIFEIAGSKSLELKANNMKMSVENFFKNGIEQSDSKSSLFIKDVANAVALLSINTAKKYNITNIHISVYNSYNLDQSSKQRFIELIQGEIFENLENIHVNLIDFSSTEMDLQMIGTAKFASIQKASIADKLKYIPFKNIYAITGLPTSGKSTFANKIFTELKNLNVKVGGLLTVEQRGADHNRSGFSTLTCLSQEQPIYRELAVLRNDIKPEYYYRRFKDTQYFINFDNISNHIIPAIQKACINEDVIIIDEVGAMQLSHFGFQTIISDIFTNLQKPVIFTIPFKSQSDLVNNIREEAKKKGSLFILDKENRILSQQQAFDKLMSSLADVISLK